MVIWRSIGDREKEREAAEEDGDKSDGSMGEKREVRMIEGKRMEHLEDDKRGKGERKRGEKLEGKRVGEENVEEERGREVGKKSTKVGRE